MSAQNGEIDTLSTDDLNSRQPATLPRATVPRAYRKSILRPSTSTPQGPEAGPSSLQSPSPPTTPTRPRTFFRRSLQSSSDPSLMKAPETPVNHKGKRKAEEIDITPPEQRHEQHATFVIPSLGHRREFLSLFLRQNAHFGCSSLIRRSPPFRAAASYTSISRPVFVSA